MTDVQTKSYGCSASVLRIRERSSVRLTHSHPQQTDNPQPASQHLSTAPKPIAKSKQRKEKDTQSIRFLPSIQSAVTAMYSPVTVSLTFLCWSLSLPLSHTLPSLCFFFSFLCIYLFFFSPPHSVLPILFLACSWTEWTSTALRSPVSMAVWASKASQQDAVVQMSRGRSLTQPSGQPNKPNGFSLQSCWCWKQLPGTLTSVAEDM